MDYLFVIFAIVILVRVFSSSGETEVNRQGEKGETEDVWLSFLEEERQRRYDPSNVTNISNPANPAYDAFTRHDH